MQNINRKENWRLLHIAKARGSSRQNLSEHTVFEGGIYAWCSSMESAGLQNRKMREQSLPPVPGRKIA